MLPQFGATADSLSKASSLVFRIGTDAHLYDDPDDVNIALLLESKYDSERIEALKRLLALIAQGSDVSNFFPQVVKNVASQTLELKKLVYLYLLHYAEKRPNEALLSINCFQKDLSDPNPLVRAWALRMMAGIRLHAIGPIVLMAISKCARDPSTYVRKCAAYALPKLYDLHQEENVSTIEELVGLLLSDHSPGVIGAAAIAYNSVCSHNLAMIGRTFRRLCEALPDVDEWGQIILIEVLLRYVVARHGLVQESIMFSLNCSKTNGFPDSSPSSCNNNRYDTSEAHGNKLSTLPLRSYLERSETYLLHTDYSIGKGCDLHSEVFTTCQNDDIKLLLQCTSPLLWSQNSSVILAAAGVHWIMSSRDDVDRIVKPLLFLLRSSYASKYVVLCNIQVFTKAMPYLFAPYYEDFYVYSSDSYQIRALKLDILSTIATDSSISYIVREFQDYVKDPDRRFAADTVAAIGLCAQKIPSVSTTSLEGLLALIREESSVSKSSVLDSEAAILVQAIMSVKMVVSQNPSAYDKVIVHLARNLDKIRYSSARALIVWMLGEYSSIGQIIPRVLPVILKYLARCFTSEELEMKHQILNATVKVMLSAQGEDLQIFKSILDYVLKLAKYDMNYDVRDRAHVMEKLLAMPVNSCLEEGISCASSNNELPNNLAVYIFGGKTHSESYQSTTYKVYLPGTLSQVVLHAAPGYQPLPGPCTLQFDMDYQTDVSESRSVVGNSTESNDSYTLSGSSDEETNYDLQSHSAVDSESPDLTGDVNDNDHFPKDDIQHAGGTSQLICLDGGDCHNKMTQGADSEYSKPLSTDLAELMSKTALESWLEEQPSLPGPSSSFQTGHQASVRISVKEIAVSVKPNIHQLLEPVNGNGLKVEYTFPGQISNVSPLFVCVDLSFKNLSAEPLTNIMIKDIEKSTDSASPTIQSQECQLATTGIPRVITLEEIAYLGPNEEVKKTLNVQFHHHLLPLKLVVLCCEKKYPVKLHPDVGYFIKPLLLDLETFRNIEYQLPGMFECSRRCAFTDHINSQDLNKDCVSVNDDKIINVCQWLASKVLSSANVFFVSVDMPVSNKVDNASGLCLRFSGETLSTSKPCLITIVVAEGKCSEPLDLYIKVNCEETVFGLNLLNRFVAFLSGK